MERIGIYGGTFNPPHIGHITAAAQAVEILGLDRLLLIPGRIAPHKQLPENSATAQQRLDMITIAAKAAPGLRFPTWNFAGRASATPI
jgi:nicotinate-nucleotide adenylyltransferase